MTTKDSRIGLLLAFLQNWYANECNGDWEHSFGVTLETIDNPGWLLRVDLAETDFEDVTVERTQVKRTDQDWYQFEVNEMVFSASGGVANLGDILAAFRDFVDPERLIEH